MDTRRHGLVLAGLVCLSTAVQIWSLHAAVVPAIDSVRWLGISQALERDGVVATWRQHGDQPLFPMIVRGSDLFLHAIVGERPHQGALAVQFAAAVPLVLAVVPVYLLTLHWLGRRAALAGGVLFCLLPEVARLGAEGLADSTHLFFYCVALWCLVEYCSPVKNRKTLWLLGGGASLGLASLACAQALLIAPAVCLGLGLLQTRSLWRQSWIKLTLNLGAFALALAIVLLPYLVTTRALSPAKAWKRLVGWHDTTTVAELNVSSTHENAEPPATKFEGKLPDGSAMLFPRKEAVKSSRFHGHAAAVGEYLRETPQAFHYVVGLLALLGIWFRLGKAWRQADVVVATLFVVYSLAVIHHAAEVGYLSTRHLVPLVPLGVGWAGRGAHGLASLLVRLPSITAAGSTHSAPAALVVHDHPIRRWLRWPGLGQFQVTAKRSGARLHPHVLGWLLVAFAVATCLPRTLSPIHAGLSPYRAAATWLVNRAPGGGRVLDTHGWTALYTARATYRYDAAQRAFNDPQLAYVVAERHEVQSNSDRGRTLKELLRRGGQRVAVFEDPSNRARAGLLIYRWNPGRY